LIESYPGKANCPAIAGTRTVRRAAAGSASDNYFEIDSNKRSVAADVMRHRAGK
jgi:hypothetical protein